jgi:hypothetical protein
MKKHINKLSIKSVVFAMLAINFSACTDHNHDDDHQHEEESINKVELTLTPDSLGLPAQTVIWSDLDGDGGNAPLLPDTLKLVPGIQYTAELNYKHVHNGIEHSVNTEIRNEADEHLVCYSPIQIIQVVILEITRTDKDNQGKELGLTSKWKALISEKGAVRISLKHQPNGIKNGSCDIGETDAEVDFPYSSIQ